MVVKMEKSQVEVKHSKWVFFSNGFGRFNDEFLTMAFGAYVFFFYETEIKLDVWLVGLGFIIFALYDMINDPLIGYLTDRPFKFTRRWGRRFPWILIGGVPWIICYTLLFSPPTIDAIRQAWIIFFWLIFATCLYDTFCTIYMVNFYALFPDKFRSVEERRRAAGLGITVSIFGVVLGSIIPPLFITFGNVQSYSTMAIAVLIVCLIALVLAIPGIRDDRVHIDLYLEKAKEGLEREPFFKTMKTHLKQKSLIAYFIAFVLYQSTTACMIASIPYLVRYVLRMEADAITLIMAGFLIGALISIPVWIFIGNRINDNRKTIIIAGSIMTLFTAPLIFVSEYFIFVLAVLLWGFGLGGFWILLDPVLGDAIDEQVIRTGKRTEGITYGVRAFFGRFSLVAQALTFAIVHTLTGFNEQVELQSPEAIWGIHVHLALIPMIFILLSTIVFWKLYDLTADKVKMNKQKLAEMGL
jgi:GPH family glycoside/pentoside/hexuronide:cation symporter